MRGALIVNPFDIAGTAESLDRALSLPLEERKERHASLMEQLRRYSLSHWRDHFLRDLAVDGPDMASDPARETLENA